MLYYSNDKELVTLLKNGINAFILWCVDLIMTYNYNIWGVHYLDLMTPEMKKKTNLGNNDKMSRRYLLHKVDNPLEIYTQYNHG